MMIFGNPKLNTEVKYQILILYSELWKGYSCSLKRVKFRAFNMQQFVESAICRAYNMQLFVKYIMLRALS